MTRTEFLSTCLFFVLILYIVFVFILNIKQEKEIRNQYQHTIDSLSKLQKCYCTKLQFLDTLTDKEIDLAFKKSRGRIL
jgi:hypothetical protein